MTELINGIGQSPSTELGPPVVCPLLNDDPINH